MAPPLARRAVSALFPCSTGTDIARSTWVSVLEDEAGPVDPVGIFRIGTGVCGDKTSTQERSFPLGLSEKGDWAAGLAPDLASLNVSMF